MIKSAVTTLLLVGSVLAAIAFTRCDGAPALSFDAPRPHDSTLAEQLTRAGNAAWLRPVGMDGNVKPAVVVPTPSTIPFFVRPESTTVLQFEYGVSSAGSKAPADRFEFAVLAQRSDGTVSPVFRQTPGYDAPARWQLARVPLETFAGDEVVLHFQIRRARPKDGTDREAGYSIVEQTVIPAWANVRIRTKRSAETGALPNIVWITIDTVRADHLGCYGYDRPTSPAIDALADEGIRIAHAYANSPWTRPSVASMLFSRYPHHVDAGCGDEFHIPEDGRTLPAALSERGYRTAAFVNNPQLRIVGVGITPGFDEYLPVMGEKDVAENYIRFQEQHGDGPFFAYLHFLGAHVPYGYHDGVSDTFVDEALGRRVAERLPDRRAFDQHRPTGAELTALIGLYDGAIRRTDSFVEQVLAAVERDGLRDRTYVVVTSDHGEEFAEHGGYEHGHSLHREVLHVPLILSPPGGVPGAIYDDRAVGLVDVAPTLLEFAGIAAPDSFEGRAISRSDDFGVLSENLLYTRELGCDAASLTTRALKVIANSDAYLGVYDLAGDPDESTNLTSDRAAAAAAALKIFREHLRDATGRQTLQIAVESPADSDWTITIEPDRPVEPVLDDTARSWTRLPGGLGSMLRLHVGADRSGRIEVPLDVRLGALRLKFRTDGLPLTEEAVRIPDGAGRDREAILANLASDASRKALAAPRPTGAPGDEGPSVSIWIERADVDAVVHRDDDGLIEQLRAIGYYE